MQFYFTKELEDQHIKEKDNGIFVCETNKKKIPVDWFIDDKPVVPGAKMDFFLIQPKDQTNFSCPKGRCALLSRKADQFKF